MFSFVLLDESVTPSRIIAARDPIGITTLYQGWSSKRPGATYFASELKAIVDECDEIISFPPGHVYDSRDRSTWRYYQPSWWNGDVDGPEGTIPTTPCDFKLLRETLEEAVRKRLMSEVPYGVLLSGGLDSSLIAAIAARETEKVAHAQAETRRRKLQEAQSGPPSPIGVMANEYCEPSSMLGNVLPLTVWIQRRLRPGLSCTHSPSVLKTLQISLQHAKRHIISAQCTMNTCSPCKRAWTRFQMSSTTLRLMT